MINDNTIYSVTINDVTAKGTFKNLAKTFGIDEVQKAIAVHYKDHYWSDTKQEFILLSDMNEQHLRNAIVSHFATQIQNYVTSLRNSRTLSLVDFHSLITGGIQPNSELQKLATELGKRVQNSHFRSNYSSLL